MSCITKTSCKTTRIYAAWLERFDHEMASGQVAAAMITSMYGASSDPGSTNPGGKPEIVAQVAREVRSFFTTPADPASA